MTTQKIYPEFLTMAEANKVFVDTLRKHYGERPDIAVGVKPNDETMRLWGRLMRTRTVGEKVQSLYSPMTDYPLFAHDEYRVYYDSAMRMANSTTKVQSIIDAIGHPEFKARDDAVGYDDSDDWSDTIPDMSKNKYLKLRNRVMEARQEMIRKLDKEFYDEWKREFYRALEKKNNDAVKNAKKIIKKEYPGDKMKVGGINIYKDKFLEDYDRTKYMDSILNKKALMDKGKVEFESYPVHDWQRGKMYKNDKERHKDMETKEYKDVILATGIVNLSAGSVERRRVLTGGTDYPEEKKPVRSKLI
jgi:hypothetical protein